MENGNVISLRPELGTLVTLHDKPTRPMVKVGRSAAAEVMSRREFLNMLIRRNGKVCRGNLTTTTRGLAVEKVRRILSHYIDFGHSPSRIGIWNSRIVYNFFYSPGGRRDNSNDAAMISTIQR